MTSVRPPADWCRTFGLDLLGDPPRGWCDATAPGWAAPLTVDEFYRRACRSKLDEGYSPYGWLALMDAANAAQDRERAGRAGNGVHWVVQVGHDGYGAMFSDGEQVHLPGPVVSLHAEAKPFDLPRYRPIATQPNMIAAPWRPDLVVGVRLAPRPGDTFTLVDGNGLREGGGKLLATICPTCGTRQES